MAYPLAVVLEEDLLVLVVRKLLLAEGQNEFVALVPELKLREASLVRLLALGCIRC